MTTPAEKLAAALREIRDRNPASYGHDTAEMRADDWECANKALAEYDALAVQTFPGETAGGNDHRARYVMTGEHRPPRAGEWYISGALPMAYRARNDLSTAYRIAVKVSP